MKHTLPFLFAFAIIASLGYYVQSDVATTYTPRTVQSEAQAWAGAKEIREKMTSNYETGEVDMELIAKVNDAVKKVPRTSANKSVNVDWIQAGPNNVGGRTRAIHTFKDNPNIVFAGGVSGGLFKSTNAGFEWERVPSFDENYIVSAIARTGDGRLYVGTGHRYEQWLGNGLFVSEDGGATWNHVQDFFPQNTFSTSEDWNEITVLEADPVQDNKLWIGYKKGLSTYTWGDTDVVEKLGPSYCSSLDISDNGQSIITIIANQVFVSNDGGATFTDRSGNAFGQVPSSGVGRAEVAIAKDNPNFMYVVLVTSSSYLKGVWASSNGGANWTEIAPDSQEGALPFAPFRVFDADTGLDQGQGLYDCALSVVPGTPTQIILGGIRMYTFEMAQTNPPAGQWSSLNVNFSNGPNPLYVHSDIHRFHWDVNGVLYIGCDGGVFKSYNQMASFVPSNYNYITTQFYGISFNYKGHIVGGTQDNGTQFIDGFNLSPNDASSIRGGDGFDCAGSQFDPDFVVATIYNNNVARSFDGGVSFNAVADELPGPFWTRVDLFERNDESMALESYNYISPTDQSAGTVVDYVSESYNIPLTYELTADIAEGESILLPDPAQSLFAVGGSGQFWITRDVTKETVPAGALDYANINGISGTVSCFAFSPSGDIMYIGTTGGRVYRISGLRTAYNGADLQAVASASLTTIYQGGGFVSDIAVDQSNPNRVAVSRAQYGGGNKVLISEQASTTTTTSSFISAWNLPGDLADMPVYSVTFDITTPNRIYAGTEYGVWASDNLGDSWEECNSNMGRVPVYAMEQQTKTVDQVPGILNEGAIYAGTYGRGIFYIGDYILGVEDVNDIAAINELELFPNPVNNIANLRFDLETSANVNVDVYDITGKLVAAKPQGRLSNGEHLVEINVSDLRTGNYVMVLTVDGNPISKRFVVTR